MDKLKVALTGTSGLIGKDMWEALKDDENFEVWGVGRRKPDYIPLPRWRTLDIVDALLTAQTITQINPDCVIHFAAISNPDECEKDPETAYKANALGTRNLALACQRFDAELLYVSTDQVFNGKSERPYREIDLTAPLNHYGKSKLWGEDFVRTLLPRHYVVRTALVFGLARPTFLDRVVNSALNKEPLTAAVDLVNSPTYSWDLCQAIKYLIGTHVYGTYHIANEGHVNRYELASFVAESLGLNADFIMKGSQLKLGLPALRPEFSPLENFVWNLNGFPKLRHWKEAVLDFLEAL